MSYNNEFPTGEPLLDESRLTQIASRLDELIVKFNALPRFQEKVIEWDEEIDRRHAAQQEWEEKRSAQELHALTRRRLLIEAAGPPDDGWCFEGFRLRDIADYPVTGGVGPVIGAWFPPELCWDNCPETGKPLPVPDVEVKLCEIYAALSAIYDHTTKGNRKINPWTEDRDPFAGIRYRSLMDMVPKLPESDENHLLAWIRRIEKDLQPALDAAGEGAAKPWADKADGFISVKDALKILGEDAAPSASAVSKHLKPDGRIRYMRKGQRTKVHVNDWKACFESRCRQFGNGSLFETLDQYTEDIEARKQQEHKRKACDPHT